MSCLVPLWNSTQSFSEDGCTFIDSFISKGTEFLLAPVDDIVDGTLILVKEWDDKFLVDQGRPVQRRHAPNKEETLKSENELINSYIWCRFKTSRILKEDVQRVLIDGMYELPFKLSK